MRDWLIAIRMHKKLSQKDVANAIDVSQPTYWEYEHGVSTPSVRVAKRIAAYLGFDWTLFYDDLDTTA